MNSRKCPICHSPVPQLAKKCRHCHNYLGFSIQWAWAEGVRVLGLLAMVAAAIVAWKSFEFTLIAEKQKEEALTQAAISRQEHEALKEDLVTSPLNLGFFHWQGNASAAQEKSLRAAMEKTSDLRVRRLLDEAVKLQLSGVAFRMGGKSPEEGFDSSGLVSYLLAGVGVLDPMYHRTFSVARLEKSFIKIKPEQVKPGDLVFLDSSFVAIHLDGDLAVGIGSSKGIQVFTFSPDAKRTFHRWAYGQDIHSLK